MRKIIGGLLQHLRSNESCSKIDHLIPMTPGYHIEGLKSQKKEPSVNRINAWANLLNGPKVKSKITNTSNRRYASRLKKKETHKTKGMPFIGVSSNP